MAAARRFVTDVVQALVLRAASLAGVESLVVAGLYLALQHERRELARGRRYSGMIRVQLA